MYLVSGESLGMTRRDLTVHQVSSVVILESGVEGSDDRTVFWVEVLVHCSNSQEVTRWGKREKKEDLRRRSLLDRLARPITQFTLGSEQT